MHSEFLMRFHPLYLHSVRFFYVNLQWKRCSPLPVSCCCCQNGNFVALLSVSIEILLPLPCTFEIKWIKIIPYVGVVLCSCHTVALLSHAVEGSPPSWPSWNQQLVCQFKFPALDFRGHKCSTVAAFLWERARLFFQTHMLRLRCDKQWLMNYSQGAKM